MSQDVSFERLFVDERMERPWSARFPEGRIAAISIAGPHRTGANEDAAMVMRIGETLVAAVADGLGGGPDGEIASRVALERLCATVQGSAIGDGDQLRTAVMTGIDAANLAVQQLGSGAATTLAVIEVQAGLLRTYHVGDSIVLLVSRGGVVRYETVAHSPVGYGVESGMLDVEAAMHHEHRHLVFNVVGTRDMRIEVGPVLPLSSRDTVIVATDGITDNLHRSELAEIATRGSLDGAIKSATALARQRMQEEHPGVPSKPDDLSLLLFRPAPRARSK